MIDLKALRENPDLFRASQKVRGEDPALIDQLIQADDLRRTAITEFEALRAEEERSIEVEVISAYELSSSQSESLRAALHAKFNKEITIEATVDASLVGGAIIRAGDIVIDGSVKGRLAKLVETLVQA
mgnify:CR=1 FL=1